MHVMQKRDEFLKEYGQLNQAQKEAVDTIEGPVMVVAGPGTGKTTILTLRIAKILDTTDTPPSGILAITFTESGVKAMRKKLKKIIGPRAHEVGIFTFHGFASSVLAEFGDHFTHRRDAEQLSDIATEEMIRNLLKDKKFMILRPLGDPDFYVSSIIGAISDMKREAITPNAVRDYVNERIEFLKNDKDSISSRGATKGELKADVKKEIEKCERTKLFADVFEAYEEKKKQDKKIDFDDLIDELYFALKTDELLLRMLQEKYLYIFVDEHQDTNNAQNEIVRLLGDFFDTPNVFIVGDEKQAIFRFQGASVENFFKFKSIWKNVKTIVLTENYRSHQTILDATFPMIENNYAKGEFEELRKELSANSDETAQPIEVLSAPDTNTVEYEIVKKIGSIRANDKDSTIAIITKTNSELSRIIGVLEENGIAVSSERSIDIFSAPVGILFFDLLEYLEDGTRYDSFARTLVSGMWGLTFEATNECLKELRAGRVDILSKISSLQKVREKIVDEGAFTFLIYIANESGYEKIIARDPLAVEVWRGITVLAEKIARDGNITDPRVLITRLLEYRKSAKKRAVKIPIGTPDLPVRAMTAHGSKGLEFDYVFIPYATEESWIGRTWGNYFILPVGKVQNEIVDIRRLFYVALTRARKHVVICVPEGEGEKVYEPLRFIDELNPSSIEHIQIKNVEKELKTYKKDRGDNNQRYIDHAKYVLSTSGLSVTALNRFMSCPSAFLYESILKIPQAPSSSAEKGNSMHEAISRVWAQKERSVQNIENTLVDSIPKYFSHSLLPRFEQEVIIQKLINDAPIVARSLYQHFNIEGDVFSETWSETEFVFDYEKEKVSIKIHGKLDAIISGSDFVNVYDYKTRQGMSENEIKGNTKNSTGDYFRQLVYYKMLIAEDSRFSGKNIVPSLIFVSPDKKGECAEVSFPIEKNDVEKLVNQINELVRSVWSGEFMQRKCDDQDCKWCPLKNFL